jgi:DNA polymerase (family 10)
VDNRALAQVFAQIADLLEIKGENAFKIRAYRSAAETIGEHPDAVAKLDPAQLRELPGIGKDLAAKIRELVDTGDCVYHRELLQVFPPTILDLLRLQGVGPKTVALLYGTLGISSLDTLAAAAREGRLRGIKGMGAKKEALMLKAIEERQRDGGRTLLARAAATADDLLRYLRGRFATTEFIPVGSLRRGCETCGDLDILAVGADPGVMDAFVEFPGVERVLARGDSKSSIRLPGGLQADLRLVPPESRGAAMQYFTGSKAHNIALRDLAVQRGLKLNEYGLFTVENDTRLAGHTEASIYETLGLTFIDPALREDRGEITAAARAQLPRLIRDEDLRGDLHMHTTETDGRDDLDTMAAAALARGHQYIAITEHSRALAMANGLDETRALAHAARIRALNGRYEGLTLLAGIECDILGDGRLDLADDCLAQLDLVVASVHSQMAQEPEQITDRLLRAMECPWVDVLGHPTARRLLRRDAMRYDFEAVTARAASLGVAMEINCQIERLDLNDTHARMARDRGVRLVISTDAHSTLELQNQHWGVQTARRGWITPEDVLNTRDLDSMRTGLRRHRTQSPETLGSTARG